MPFTTQEKIFVIVGFAHKWSVVQVQRAFSMEYGRNRCLCRQAIKSSIYLELYLIEGRVIERELGGQENKDRILELIQNDVTTSLRKLMKLT
jgi:hypothetical protein